MTGPRSREPALRRSAVLRTIARPSVSVAKSLGQGLRQRPPTRRARMALLPHPHREHQRRRPSRWLSQRTSSGTIRGVGRTSPRHVCGYRTCPITASISSRALCPVWMLGGAGSSRKEGDRDRDLLRIISTAADRVFCLVFSAGWEAVGGHTGAGWDGVGPGRACTPTTSSTSVRSTALAPTGTPPADTRRPTRLLAFLDGLQLSEAPAIVAAPSAGQNARPGQPTAHNALLEILAEVAPDNAAVRRHHRPGVCAIHTSDWRPKRECEPLPLRTKRGRVARSPARRRQACCFSSHASVSEPSLGALSASASHEASVLAQG